MKTKTQKQLTLTQKAHKPIAAYLEEQQKLADAFKALQAKQDTLQHDRARLTQQAGDQEAKVLLGQSAPDTEPSLDKEFAALRDRQDRLDAARAALCQQQKALDAILLHHQDTLTDILHQLSRACCEELEEELRLAVQQVNAVIFKLYALNSTIGTERGYTRELFEMSIPSILHADENLFVRPITVHPRYTDDLQQESWKTEASAVKLAESLQPFAASIYQLSRLEKRLQDAA